MVWWAWIILGIACVAIEVHFTHDFSLFCVGVGAFIVAAVILFTNASPHWSQWILFGGLSVVILVGLRKPLLGRFQAHRGKDADFQYLVGEVATPADDLPANAVGRAELRGSSWSARNGDATGLRKGQRCRVERVEGLTVWLRAE
ncbi:MAG: NfeD family protein [Candidatus Binataceae bacterium]|jgi:membrane protein implicated in regulation of membrane protease activity